MLNTLLSGLACKSPWLPYSPIALSLVLSLTVALAFALTLALLSPYMLRSDMR